jgi:hypothetical protein
MKENPAPFMFDISGRTKTYASWYALNQAIISLRLIGYNFFVISESLKSSSIEPLQLGYNINPFTHLLCVVYYPYATC